MKQVELMVRYTKEFILAIFAYIITLVASNSMLMNVNDASFWCIPLAIAPAIPVAFVIHAILRLLMSGDELQRKIQLLAIGFAAGITSMVTFTYGFLEGIGFAHMSPIWILPMMIFFWGLGQAYFSRRYQ